MEDKTRRSFSQLLETTAGRVKNIEDSVSGVKKLHIPAEDEGLLEVVIALVGSLALGLKAWKLFTASLAKRRTRG